VVEVAVAVALVELKLLKLVALVGEVGEVLEQLPEALVILQTLRHHKEIMVVMDILLVVNLLLVVAAGLLRQELPPQIHQVMMLELVGTELLHL
jgi:hypothetical protein